MWMFYLQEKDYHDTFWAIIEQGRAASFGHACSLQTAVDHGQFTMFHHFQVSHSLLLQGGCKSVILPIGIFKIKSYKEY